MKRILFTLSIVAAALATQAQNLDSLWAVWNDNTQADSSRLKAMQKISWDGYLFNQPDSAFYYAQMVYDLAKKNGLKKTMAGALNTQGSSFWVRGNYPKMQDYYRRSLKIYEEINYKRGIALTQNNMGAIYKESGDFPIALDYFQRGLKTFEELGDKIGISSSIVNLGVIHTNLGNYPKALEYLQRSLKIQVEIDDKRGLARSLQNIGHVYINKGTFPKAMDNYQRSLKIFEKIDDKNGIASILNNIGNLYQKQGDDQQAINQCGKSFLLAQEIEAIVLQRHACQCLYNSYKAAGNSTQALAFHEQYIILKDSIFNKENTKKLTQLEMQYDFDKKEAAARLKQEKKDALVAANIKRNKLIRNGFIGAFTIMLLFALVFFTQRNKIKKDNLLISEQKRQTEIQKEVIEESHKEITDSIAYAKRIQSAILPPIKLVQQYLDNFFILYKPKDVVAGDFYWMEPRGNTVFFAAADCTGHGVPGAMVSVICVNGLNRSVREFGLTEPGEILDNTRQLVIKEFEKSEEEVKDGMDIALCALEGNTLKYAGANNPLWIVRNGDIIETKGDKQPIGKYALEAPFITHSIELQTGDNVYIFSDGYVDQFGGERNKKFKAKALRELLLSIQDSSMEEQRSIIDSAFETWRGDNEQIDDVCFIGVRI